MRTVTTHVAITEFGDMMDNMRIWCDDQGITPRRFNYAQDRTPGKIAITITFDTSDDARAFAQRFGSSQAV